MAAVEENAGTPRHVRTRSLMDMYGAEEVQKAIAGLNEQVLLCRKSICVSVRNNPV